VRRLYHDHEPVYRVVRRDWDDPLDASFSRRAADRRWNTAEFAALYCCCSEGVARAVTLDVFRYAGLVLDDLQPQQRPQLAEIGWSGPVVDVVSGPGVESAGFPPEYPGGVDKQTTREAAARWHDAGEEGVCGRSASLARLGVSDWSGDHRRFGELALFVANTVRPPRLVGRRNDLSWFRSSPVAESR
jgi:hypothetical protein